MFVSISYCTNNELADCKLIILTFSDTDALVNLAITVTPSVVMVYTLAKWPSLSSYSSIKAVFNKFFMFVAFGVSMPSASKSVKMRSWNFP